MNQSNMINLKLCVFLCALASLSACQGRSADTADTSPPKTQAPPPPKTPPTHPRCPLHPPPEPPKTPSADASPPKKEPKKAIPLTRALTQAELRTTSCSIYLNNLDGIIRQTEKRLATSPTDPKLLSSVASLLYSRARFSDDLPTLTRALTLADQALTPPPTDPDILRPLLISRIRIRSTLHLFPQALADLAELSKITPATPESKDYKAFQALSDDLLLNTSLSVPPDLLARVKNAPISSPSFDTYTAAALLYADMGDTKTADLYFAQAERHFDDTSPLPLAWLNVQRGLLFLNSGDFPRARSFYLSSLERCPTYPLALEHLAEIEHLLDNTPRAIELYDQVITATQNPEFISALADIYAAQNNTEKAQKLLADATSIYTNLLEKYPEAMFWHAADFFASQNPSLSLSLLSQNASIRPTPDAFYALAAAQLTCGFVKEAKESIDKALSSHTLKPEFLWTASQIASALSLPSEAAQLKERALKINPKIEVLEGPADPPPHLQPLANFPKVLHHLLPRHLPLGGTRPLKHHHWFP